jgi:hypothetical protein
MTWHSLIFIILLAQSPNSITDYWQKAAFAAQGKVGPLQSSFCAFSTKGKDCLAQAAHY